MPALVSRGRGRRTINEINMVPFIDVMLVLLIIFMVTATVITPGAINIPTAGQSSKTPDKRVDVLIDADGKPANGWKGYDCIVNRLSGDEKTAVLEKNAGGWNWKEAARVPCRVQGREMHMAIPRAALGLPPVANVRDHVYSDRPWLAADPVLPAGLAGTAGWEPRPLSTGHQNRSHRRIGRRVSRVLRIPGKISIRSLWFTSLFKWVFISDSQQFQ